MSSEYLPCVDDCPFERKCAESVEVGEAPCQSIIADIFTKADNFKYTPPYIVIVQRGVVKLATIDGGEILVDSSGDEGEQDDTD